MQNRQIKDLMRVRHGLVVPETATVREVAERLIISDCDVMAVTGSDGRLAGIVCESSVIRILMTNPPENTTIQSIVSRHAESVRLDASLGSVLPLFRSSAHTAIPVVDSSGCVCGLLMRRDVICSLINRRVDLVENTPTDNNTPSEQKTPTTSGMRAPFSRPGQNFVAHSGDDAGPVGAQKPHFLRADAARRILWAAEDRL